MSKELTKEEILESYNKIEDYYKGAGITLEDAEFAMQEYSDQNTKPLIEEIAKLKAEYKSFAENVNNYFNGGCGTIEEMINKVNSVNSDLTIKGDINYGLIIDGKPVIVKTFKEEANEVVELHQMFGFTEFATLKYIRRNNMWCHKHASQTDKNNWITTSELYEIFKTRNNK